MLDASPDRDFLEAKAHAKLNLALAVAPPRAADGMHPIASWMARIDLCDDLLITRLEPDRLSRYAILWADDAPVKTHIDWSITQDLAVRAHLLLEEEVGRALPIQLKLEKRVPVGGGLGGGSSDAAATLLLVRDLFDLDVTDGRLREIAMTLGSDVAFFLGRGPALVGGLGDEIEATPGVESEVVLVLPDFGCPTGQVYRAYDENPGDGDGFDRRVGLVREMAHGGRVDAEALFNDLAAPAGRVAGGLSEVIQWAQAVAEAPVHVTGSGSACFVVCEGRGAEALAEDLRDEFEAGEGLGGCRVVVARLVH